MFEFFLSFVLVVSALSQSSAEQLTINESRALLYVAGWPLKTIPEALDVMHCESRRIPNRIGDQGKSRGLLQIQWTLPANTWGGWRNVPEMSNLKTADIMDPLINLRAGLIIYQNFGGWNAWTCQPN